LRIHPITPLSEIGGACSGSISFLTKDVSMILLPYRSTSEMRLLYQFMKVDVMIDRMR
jgi:hypothetical protein